MQEQSDQQQLIKMLFYSKDRVSDKEEPESVLKTTDSSKLDASLSAYRGNARANVARGLSITYPRVKRIVGEEFLSALGWQYFLTNPDSTGDWALWSQGFADFTAQQSDLLETHSLDYLPDLLRLEWACQEAERAGAVEMRLESLSLLESEPAKALTLFFSPSVSLMRSSHPLIMLSQLNEEGSDKSHCMSEIKSFYENDESCEHLIVYRQDYKAQVEAIQPSLYAWLYAAKDSKRFDRLIDLSVDLKLDLGEILQMLIAKTWFYKVESCSL